MSGEPKQSRLDKFEETARELECDDDKHFDERLRKRVKQKSAEKPALRHVAFIVGLLVALIAALPMTLQFFMHECPLEREQEAVDLCYAQNDFWMKAYFGTVLVVAVAAVSLHLSRKKWAWVALLAIPVAPIAMLLLGMSDA